MENRIKEILSSVFEVPVSEIDENSSPQTIEKWDSLNHVKLILSLEEEFGITFEEEDVMDMISYELICMVVKEKI